MLLLCSDAQLVKYGAVAVVMSGGYKDNADTGETFTYTGEGGMKEGKQVRLIHTGSSGAPGQHVDTHDRIALANTAVQLALLFS